jgi:predicted DNA-binding transcriptional regulator AlpA
MRRMEADLSTQLPEFLDRHRILNVRQMAEVLGFSVPHLRRLYRSGKVAAPTKIGGRKLGWPAGVAIDMTATVKSEKAAA